METPLIVALMGGLFALVGYIAAHRFAMDRDRQNARIAAGTKFREKILHELGPVYPIITQWPENGHAFFKSIFPAMQSAVAEFRPFVPWWKRRFFDKAWL